MWSPAAASRTTSNEPSAATGTTGRLVPRVRFLISMEMGRGPRSAPRAPRTTTRPSCTSAPMSARSARRIGDAGADWTAGVRVDEPPVAVKSRRLKTMSPAMMSFGEANAASQALPFSGCVAMSCAVDDDHRVRGVVANAHELRRSVRDQLRVDDGADAGHGGDSAGQEDGRLRIGEVVDGDSPVGAARPEPHVRAVAVDGEAVRV